MRKILAYVFVAMLLCSCVGRGTYRGAMREIEDLEDKVSRLEDEKEELEWRVDELENEKTELEEQVEELEDIIERARRRVHDADLDISLNNSFSASFSISDALRILNEL